MSKTRMYYKRNNNISQVLTDPAAPSIERRIKERFIQEVKEDVKVFALFMVALVGGLAACVAVAVVLANASPWVFVVLAILYGIAKYLVRKCTKVTGIYIRESHEE